MITRQQMRGYRLMSAMLVTWRWRRQSIRARREYDIRHTRFSIHIFMLIFHTFGQSPRRCYYFVQTRSRPCPYGFSNVFFDAFFGVNVEPIRRFICFYAMLFEFYRLFRVLPDVSPFRCFSLIRKIFDRRVRLFYAVENTPVDDSRQH